MPGEKIWVVKLGGSLAETPELISWLKRLVACGGGRVIIVPGGGPFADQVRKSQLSLGFDDKTAHLMALHAMDQFGLMCCGLEPGLFTAQSFAEIHEVLSQRKVALWLPERMLSVNSTLPTSWDITSDSIAAWLARKMNAAHLLLVKFQSVKIDQLVIADLQASGVVDKDFGEMLVGVDFEWTILGKREYARFSMTD
ncbi:MAG: uridylate kinase [Gammaproteobacteria bacterium]